MTKDGDPGREVANLTASADGTVLMGIPLIPGLDVVASGDGSHMECSIKTEEDDDLGIGRGAEDEETDVSQMLSVVSSGGNLIRANHATLQSLLSTPISGTQVFAQQDGIQVITLPTATDVVGLGGENSSRLVQVFPSNEDLTSLGVGAKYIGLIAIPNTGLVAQTKTDMGGLSGLEMVQGTETAELNAAAAAESMAAILMPPPATVPELPPGCPQWATRLKKCEKIGDSYRGYVENEIDLDLILTLHKQQTNSFWGTRQSPSPAKASIRLMWKSQYVPFDGIPFINAGSRAVVMECQYGPRRKGTFGKRGGTTNSNAVEFKQTCPARIYIKKVRKFPAYAVDLTMDKKSIRLAMDKAFLELREQGLDSWGEERYYVQLPTDKAHDYHEESPNALKQETVVSPPVIDEQTPPVVEGLTDTRIHPAVLEKIRQMVAAGETKLYTIRKQLRKFVVCELFQCSGQVPERHDLTMFPTVNDLKNHIHQALKDIETGVLPVSAPVVNLEVMAGQESSEANDQETNDIKTELSSMWSGANVPSSTPMPESVTVTLTQNPGEDGHHMVSRIETHLSDGTTQVSTTLTPETAQLLSRLHPGLFPAGSLLQLDGSQSQPVVPESLADPVSGLEPPDASSADNPVSGLDASMAESVHVIGGLDSAHLTGMEDMDTAHNISDMMDSDAAAGISGMVSSDPTHSIGGIHLDVHHPSSHNISGIIDGDSPNFAGIVTSESHHHHHPHHHHHHHHHHIPGLSIAGSGLSVLNGVDPATISEMVSSGAAHLSIVPGHPDTIALVAGAGSEAAHTIGLVTTGRSDGGHLTLGDEACDESIMAKGQDLGEVGGADEKLSEDKITLHITSDQEMGMARLENKVSDL
ncbi:calcium-responsive transcription factor [Aplysia californica]|uniref:Calcium-responsive transcription factor n=1 Tax=Aplysia californica TaxID=6500 RepID=A0ABM1W2I8_APLCA|nr:calcium-responsive transcription factor [Aplysia californica]XP_035828881.1 calcium-responsive transcription factor [Aplysia californica]